MPEQDNIDEILTNKIINAKQSTKPPFNGWAPGWYICECSDCKDWFLGDKRAIHCAECAYKDPGTVITLDAYEGMSREELIAEIRKKNSVIESLTEALKVMNEVFKKPRKKG